MTDNQQDRFTGDQNIFPQSPPPLNNETAGEQQFQQQEQPSDFSNGFPPQQPEAPRQFIDFGGPPKPPRKRSKLPMIITLVLLGLILVGTGIWFFIFSGIINRDEPEETGTITMHHRYSSPEDSNGVSDFQKDETIGAEQNVEANVESSAGEINYNVNPSVVGKMFFKGKIDDQYAVSMAVDFENETGRYCYDKYGPSNSMNLVVEYLGSYSPYRLVLYEYNSDGEYCGRWEGYIEDGVYSGSGYYNGNYLPFRLYMCPRSDTPY